jgi:hypothetical protein
MDQQNLEAYALGFGGQIWREHAGNEFSTLNICAGKCSEALEKKKRTLIF